MAKIRIKGDTSGYIDIAAPAVAGSVTLNLPTSDATFMTTAGGTFTGNLELSGSGAGISFSGGGTTFIDAETSPLIFKTSGVERGRFTGAGDFQLYEDTGTTAKFFWDASAESLGIGTSSPSSQLTVASNGTIEMLGGSSTLKFTRTDTTTIAGNPLGAVEFAHQDTDDAGVAAKILGEGDGSSGQGRISFHTGTPSALAERMRIDSSGHLLVGTTAQEPSVSNDDSGFSIRPVGTASISRTSGASLDLNRKSTDGGIIVLRKDGTTVGSIGSRGSSHIYVALSSSGLANAGLTAGTASGSNTIFPTDSSGTTRDNGVDLGWSSGRFKDLYLSGGVYVGGTGSANHLDDYEEGTWTPALTTSGSAPTITYQVQDGTYTKIGRTVIVNCQLTLLSKSGGSGAVYMTGLPFAVANLLPSTAVESVGSMSFANMAQNVSTATPRGNHGAGGVDFVWTDGGGDASQQTLNIGNIGSNWSIRMTVTYFIS